MAIACRYSTFQFAAVLMGICIQFPQRKSLPSALRDLENVRQIVHSGETECECHRSAGRGDGTIRDCSLFNSVRRSTRLSQPSLNLCRDPSFWPFLIIVAA